MRVTTISIVTSYFKGGDSGEIQKARSEQNKILNWINLLLFDFQLHFLAF